MKTVKKQMKKIGQVTTAWETLAADKSFAGMTLAQFKTAVQPALDAQEKVTTLRSSLVDARTVLVDSSRTGHDAALFIINGVKGDPIHGEDSSLYAAMGYVRKSDRKSGLTRKAQTSTVATAKA